MSNLGTEILKGFLSSKLTVHLTVSDKANREPKLDGYSPVALSLGDWKIVMKEGKAVAISKWVEWVFKGGKASLFGYFVKKGDVTRRELFKEGPYEVIRKNDKLRIRARVVMEER
jgi:hypothetical protein